MHARRTLHQAIQSREHRCARKIFSHRLSCSGTVASDQIVLKLTLVLITDLILSHRSKTSINAINDFVLRIGLQKSKVPFNLF